MFPNNTIAYPSQEVILIRLGRRQQRSIEPKLLLPQRGAPRQRPSWSYEGERREGLPVLVPPPSKLHRHRRPRPPPGRVVACAPLHLLVGERVPEMLRHVLHVASFQPERLCRLQGYQRRGRRRQSLHERPPQAP